MTGERYELLDRIATGGMAEVFRARATGAHGFEKTLAIKRILPSLAADDEFVGRFIAEAKLAVALTHANIVQVFDFGRFGGSLYIAMEYVDGGDLATLLRALQAAERPMPVSVALHIGIELAKALDYAHRRSAQAVVHRDVSPSNILLSFAGEVKIADFGIAQAVEHARGGRKVRDGRIMGKWRYMSPEQARGDALDARSDIFSAAAVIFEMLAGRRLVPGADADTIVKNLQTMTWPRLSEIRPDVPSGLDDVLGRALERDPAQRTAHIHELMEGLAEVSYAHSVRTSSWELAELVRELLARPATETTTRSLIDDIIKSEIGATEGSAARETLAGDGEVGGEGEARTTALRPSTVASARAAGHAAGFVPGVRDARGLTEWRLAATPLPTARRGRAVRMSLGLALVAVLLGTGWVLRGRQGPASNPTVVPLAALRVNSTPDGAELWVDGRASGRRTPVVEPPLFLKPGRHVVGLRLTGYQPAETTVVLESGRTDLPLTLEREPRLLAVGGEPASAAVRIDGVPRGTAPLEVAGLSEGAHDIVVESPGFETHHQTVALPQGGRLDVAYTLRPSKKFGRVTLNATVPGQPMAAAEVFLGGARRALCSTPCESVPLEAGHYKLRFVSRALGKTVERAIDVTPGKTTVLTDVMFD